MKVKSFGQGQPIAFLSGYAFPAEIFLPFIEYLTSDYQCLLIDLPGIGNAVDAPLDKSQIMQQLKDAIPLSAHLIGWSLGGLMAMDFARHHKEHCLSLVTLATNPCFVAKDGWPGMSLDNFSHFKNTLPLNLKKYINEYLLMQFAKNDIDKALLKALKTLVLDKPPSSRVLSEYLAMMQTGNLNDDLKAIACPSLFIYGALDRLVPVEVAHAIEHLKLPRRQTHIIDSAAHIPFLTDIDKTIATIREFYHDITD